MQLDTLKDLVLRQMLWLREDLQALCECECLGGVAAVHSFGPLRFEADVVESVQTLVSLIREAEAAVGRQGGAPPWLDALLDGRREIARAA